MLQPDPLQDLERPSLLLRGRHPEHARDERHVFEHGLGLQQFEILEDEPERPPIRLDLPRRQGGEVSPADGQFAVGRHFLAKQHPEERGLAGAARAGEEDEVAFVDANGKIAERVDAAGVRLRDVDRVNHAASPSSSRFMIELTSAGLALPPMDLITCPTRNPNV